MIVPFKPFEKMNKQERREHLEGLIEDYIIVDQDGHDVPLAPSRFLWK